MDNGTWPRPKPRRSSTLKSSENEEEVTSVVVEEIKKGGEM
jgi:hypothetical protein